jgi:sigma-B regulation protein RsbU (phosphoserine phosphatase)
MSQTMRQVRFPLKFKLLALMIILIAASLIVFVGIALKTFKEDKSAYIFESLFNKVTSEKIILAQKLGQGSFSLKGTDLLHHGEPVGDLLRNHLEEETVYTTKIVVPYQNQFFQWSENKLSELSPEEQKIFNEIFTKSLNQAVKETTLNDEKVLYAYDYDPVQNFAFVAILPQAKAFEATTYLIQKSVSYGLLILGIAMILSVLLARPLTAQLERLFAMTQEIAKGNFQNRVDIKGHDEVGALSDSVNDMADKIVIFMEEMKEKARLENEVQVAQLVQSSFFPQNTHLDGSLAIEGHFEPATECGGDWWGFSHHGDWCVFFIADATGHGVPAALLTATINCCKSSLNFILETRPTLIEEPHEILRFMNQAVCGAGKEIQVTCFVASFNKKTKRFVFANSSQTPPLLFPGSKGDLLAKDDFRPLIEANGPRLGQRPDAVYEFHALELETHDTIFFYTDGLTEAENTEGTRYGERRLIKSLSQRGLGSPVEIIEGVMSDFKSFTENKSLNDDLTAVTLKVIS